MTYSKTPTPPLTDDPAPLMPEFDGVESIRYANTPGGVLSSRSEDKVRRYVLEAENDDARAERQSALMREACVTMTTLETAGSALSGGRIQSPVVDMGIFAWPVLLCTDRPMLVYNRLDLTRPHYADVAHAMVDAFVDALEPGLCYARVVGMVNAQWLCGLSPLAIRSALLAGARHAANRPLPTDQVVNPVNTLGHMDHHEKSGAVGPNQPVAFLLIAHLAWDRARSQPTLRASLASTKDQLQSLCKAFYTHKVVGSKDIGNERLELSTPTVRVGDPQLFHDAVSQAQWMQLAWLAERARQGGFSHSFTIEKLAAYLTLSARLTDADDEVKADICYSYDGFWQTGGQLDLIDERVSLAQATGRMDCPACDLEQKH